MFTYFILFYSNTNVAVVCRMKTTRHTLSYLLSNTVGYLKITQCSTLDLQLCAVWGLVPGFTGSRSHT